MVTDSLDVWRKAHATFVEGNLPLVWEGDILFSPTISMKQLGEGPMKTSLILVVCCLAFFACREETKPSDSGQSTANAEDNSKSGETEIASEQENHLPKLIYYTISEA